MHSAQPVPLGGTSGSISLVTPVIPLLLIPLHGVRVSRLGLVGIGPGVAQGPALAQQVPTLVELDLDCPQPFPFPLQGIGIGTIGLLAAA